MIASPEMQAPPDAAPALDYDAIIIGAGMSGMYQLYRLRELGMRVRVFEAGTAIGPLSSPTMPRIEGVETFGGHSFHTARWPHKPVDFTGQRVAVIGTGATGVQTIQTIAKDVGHLTVFQRTPNWCAPLHNSKIDAETQKKIKANYPE